MLSYNNRPYSSTVKGLLSHALPPLLCLMCHPNQALTPPFGCHCTSPASLPSDTVLHFMMISSLIPQTDRISPLHPILGSGLWWQPSLYLLSILSPHSSHIAPLTDLSLCSCYSQNKHTHKNTTCIKEKLLLDNCRFPWAGFQCDFLRVLLESEFLPRPNPPPPQMSGACREPEP